ncbi:MAG: ribonuclease P protein component [Erysipelotrichaceae bacterium]
MKKIDTVKKKEDFTRIIKRGKFIRSDSFVLYYMVKNEDRPKIGIAVGKKNGDAHIRNRIKRQTREMIEMIFNHEESFDCIVLIRPKFVEFDFQANKIMLDRIYKKIKI